MAKMMVLLLLTAAAGLSLTDDRGMVKCWEGTLQLVGNEPFTHVVLVTDDREHWYLEMERDEMLRLWRDNRGRIRITGTPVSKEFRGSLESFIVVRSYEWLNEQRE
ncbi:hypothetical protein QA596_10270 [Balneolales bacterium ANBcel1]|nr:hypothetical protein [Balneolales bacterium ANBcel1]